jgi:hypothetical protein
MENTKTEPAVAKKKNPPQKIRPPVPAQQAIIQ